MNKIHSDNNSVYYVDDMCSCIFLITFNSISLGKNGGILHVVELGRGNSVNNDYYRINLHKFRKLTRYFALESKIELIYDYPFATIM